MADETVKTIDFSASTDAAEIVERAIAEPDVLQALVDNLKGGGRRGDRRIRQFSAAAINSLSAERIDLLKPYVPDLTDALFREEAQTRWQVLEAIERMVAVDADLTEQACEGAVSCLIDEGSGIVRLHGFRFLTTFAASSEEHAMAVWHYIDEAIQCYHGDSEFGEMLNALYTLASTTTSKEIKDKIIARMDFDAHSGRGGVKHRAEQIIEAAKA